MGLDQLAILTGWHHTGSELIQQVLNRHIAICGPEYGGFAMADKCNELAMRRWCERKAKLGLNNLDRTGVVLSHNDICVLAKDDWGKFYEELHKASSNDPAETTFIDHCPEYPAFMQRTMERLDNPKVVFVARDPRSVYFYWKLHNPGKNVNKFIQRYTHALQVAKKAEAHIVYYEEFLKDPLNQTAKICSYLGHTYYPSLNPEWANISRIFPWRDQLSNKECSRIERNFHQHADAFAHQIYPDCQTFLPDSGASRGVLLLNQGPTQGRKLAEAGWVVRGIRTRNGHQRARIDAMLALEHARYEFPDMNWSVVGGPVASFVGKAQKVRFFSEAHKVEGWIDNLDSYFELEPSKGQGMLG